MFDIGFWEILLIAVVALIVVGPERLPRLIRVTGLWIGRAQASLQSIRNEISKELRAEELRDALKKPDNMPDMNEEIRLDDKEKQQSQDKKQDG
ncbi:Sec-independent protein translocase protein TatB [Methylophaga sp.]|jgi:sec-independent protein translocase protein TatB|uniref:Sec-independent protein translocase protein TatB n=1 Tax=Methylophaga sp. TaxID=2024840 RepID=UPI0013FFFCE9|nr:Sec-independent protein translocase protein TatB [Methylophaga sp.]MTI62999.1 twin-arginine translocase subunit TatB [Methylophaga sp.]